MQNSYSLYALQWILSIVHTFTRCVFRFLNEDRFVTQRLDLDYDDGDGDEDHDHDWWKVRASVSRMYVVLTCVHIA